MNLIGRKKELDILNRLLESKRPEFLAVYGRRDSHLLLSNKIILPGLPKDLRSIFPERFSDLHSNLPLHIQTANRNKMIFPF